MIIEDDIKLDYSDVLIRPKRSTLTTRFDVDLERTYTFYHSGKEKRIIGIVRIIKEHFRDKTDKANKFISVMVRGEDELSKPVTLKKIKKDKFFKELALVKQSRLSVMEINTKFWKKICKMSNMA
mgnify:CR=1 FL=1